MQGRQEILYIIWAIFQSTLMFLATIGMYYIYKYHFLRDDLATGFYLALATGVLAGGFRFVGLLILRYRNG